MIFYRNAIFGSFDKFEIIIWLNNIKNNTSLTGLALKSRNRIMYDTEIQKSIIELYNN